MKTKSILIRVSDEDYKKIQAAASSEHLQNSTFVRKIVLDYIEKPNN